MGLLQKAVETYDAMAYRAGTVYEGEKEPLAPMSHKIAKSDIEITLNQSGCFISARAVDKDEPKIIIPVTEDSAGRTGSVARPHPLCDYLVYIAPGDEEKHTSFKEQLNDWVRFSNDPKLQAVLSYVESGTIISDLCRAGVIPSEQNWRDKSEKLTVCWVVNGLGEERNGSCWNDKELIESYIRYYNEKKSDVDVGLCMISGKIDMLSEQHLKGVVAKYGNAKIISANDKVGYTYRGRFTEPSQSSTVSYAASQKAHNALRWISSNQGVAIGGRTFLCWNPQGNNIPSVTGCMGRKSGNTQKSATPTQYRQELKNALDGWKNELPDNAGIVITAFDAATTGRLAVTYYNELQSSDFLQRLHDWELSCCWENFNFGIQSPTLYQIANWAFGVPRNGKPETDDRILSQQMQRLISCRIDKATFPFDIERSLVEKASNLLVYDEENRKRLIFTSCAVIRKYHYDHFKEEWSMSLDKNCSDRSYLFGRLLAVAEAVERSACGTEGDRETNAMRMQKSFSLRPMMTWRVLEEKLEPYYKQLSPGLRQYFRKQTQEIVNQISASDGNLNKKLDDIYLIGYYHQRAYREERNDNETTEE